MGQLFLFYFCNNKLRLFLQMAKYKINYRLFEETSHSPALIDIVDEKYVNEIIDYCFIANPYYPTNEMMTLLIDKFATIIKAYPSSNPRLARENLADVLKVNPDFLVLGNGATELITIIERIFIDEIAIPIPTFSEYIEKLRDEHRAFFYPLKPEEDYLLDLADYAKWIKRQNLSAALIINPGNPTGQLITQDKMRQFVKEMSNLKLILIDESFIDFADGHIPSLINDIEAYENVIIVRSMSKHCGVPGLRLGYCCTSNKKFIKQLYDALPVWNINSIAEYFLLQLRNTDKEYHESRMKVIRDVKKLYNDLKEIPGYKVYPTGSNFIFIKIETGITAKKLQHILLENYGLYVRDCSNKTGLDNYHIRVASQGCKKDCKLVDALKEISQNNTES